MGRIFGISDLPVSTIMTSFEPIIVPKPNYQEIKKPYDAAYKSDVFVSKTSPKQQSKTFINMRNGFGKLMKHFSKKLVV